MDASLRRMFGDRFVDDPHVVSLYLRDAALIEGGAALGVVFPLDLDEVRGVVREAYARGAAIYTQGAATSLSGNAMPLSGGVVLSMEKMARIHEVNTYDGYVVVEPGIRIEELNLELYRHGYFFPIDPGSHRAATVGGAINNNAGGMRGAKYGTMREWTLELEAVIPTEDADVVRVGCKTVKCRQGYDLVRLIVGSEGTLAIVTRATLRIVPLPQNVVGMVVQFDDMERAEAFLRLMRQGRLSPQFTEYMDEATSGMVGLPPRHSLFIGVEVDRCAADGTLEALGAMVKRSGGHVVDMSRDTRDTVRLLEPRRKLFAVSTREAMERCGKGCLIIAEDIAVPPSALARTIAEIREAAERLGMPLLMGGHIWDGNLHPRTWFPREDSERGHRFIRAVMEIAVKNGGTISGEHGIGTLKREGLAMELRHRGSPYAAELMRRIKAAFDPKGILNPGKLLPEDT